MAIQINAKQHLKSAKMLLRMATEYVNNPNFKNFNGLARLYVQENAFNENTKTINEFQWHWWEFMKSFTLFGPRRFDGIFPIYLYATYHEPPTLKMTSDIISLWLEARIKIASPLIRLSVNPDFVELRQLRIIFGINYDVLHFLTSVTCRLILKALGSHEIYNAPAFQEHMQRLSLPVTFQVDRIYCCDQDDINLYLCALYFDLIVDIDRVANRMQQILASDRET